MLEQPLTFGALTELFAAGFPDRPADELARDLSVLLRDLAANGLVSIG